MTLDDAINDLKTKIAELALAGCTLERFRMETPATEANTLTNPEHLTCQRVNV